MTEEPLKPGISEAPKTDGQLIPAQEKEQITQEQIDAICRHPALRFSKDMIEFANKKFEGYAPFWCPLVAAFTLQNVLILCLTESHKPGSEEGLNAINSFFDQCKFQAAAHWRNPALAKQLGGKAKSSLVVAR